MSTERKLQNARRFYVQSALSGFGVEAKPANEDSDGNKKGKSEEISPFFWEQKSYVVYVPVIITKTDVSNGQYHYDIQIPINRDVSLSPNNAKSKNLSGQAFSLVKETSRDASKIHMVYGIPEAGSNPLPPTVVDTVDKSIAHIYGRVLGFVARAIECTLQFSSEGQKLQARARDNKVGTGVTSLPESVGRHPSKGRGSKVRQQVRSEGQAEDPPILDEKDGAVLGERPRNGEDKLGGMDRDTFAGTGLEGGVVDF